MPPTWVPWSHWVEYVQLSRHAPPNCDVPPFGQQEPFEKHACVTIRPVNA